MKKFWIKKKFTSKVVTVTPKMASAMLECANKLNRKTPRHADNLAEIMRRGKWIFNGIPISFDKNGTCIDGENRLRAIVMSGKSQLMVVHMGLNPSCVYTFDDKVEPRNTAHALRISGMDSVLAEYVGPTIVKVEGFNRNQRWAKPDKLTNAEVVDYAYGKYKSVVSSAQDIVPLHSCSGGILSKAASVFLYHEMKKKDKVMAMPFMNKVLVGTDLKSGDPILKVRSKLIKSRMGLLRWSSKEKVKVLISCWNALRTTGKITKNDLSPKREAKLVIK